MSVKTVDWPADFIVADLHNKTVTLRVVDPKAEPIIVLMAKQARRGNPAVCRQLRHELGAIAGTSAVEGGLMPRFCHDAFSGKIRAAETREGLPSSPHANITRIFSTTQE